MHRYDPYVYDVSDDDIEPRCNQLTPDEQLANVADAAAWVETHASPERPHGEIIMYDAEWIELEPGIHDIDLGDPIGWAYYYQPQGWYDIHGQLTLTRSDDRDRASHPSARLDT